MASGSKKRKHTGGRRKKVVEKPLNYVQKRALRELDGGEWKTSFSIVEKASTLKVLERRGLVERRQCVEYITGYDSYDYEWRVKATTPTPQPQINQQPK